jgi:SAM-dependent methyltransferase
VFNESAEYYDLIYLPMKDYAAESAQVVALLREHNPDCRTVLDVACGTGEHGRWLAAAGFSVDGLDLNPEFVRIAREKHPKGSFFEADMRDFRLPRLYDGVVCLFSSIGYARTLEGVESTLRCCRAHLAPGGVLLVEPWFPPGVLDPSRVTWNEAANDHLNVRRECRVEVDGAMSRLYFNYEVTDAGGTRHASEMHELGIFSNDQMVDAFRSAGCAVEYDPQGLTGRGIYVARATTS